MKEFEREPQLVAIDLFIILSIIKNLDGKAIQIVLYINYVSRISV